MVGTATAETFETEVVERSRHVPVVVDFWAAWCGPCHQLSPLLEHVAERYAGRVEVVKVDVDRAPALAQRYRVQGIPSVKAFRDGAVVDEFTGVRREGDIERFFAGLLPSRADELVSQAGEADDPEPLLREALEEEPGHAGACTALARLLADRGETDEALRLLDRVPADPEAAKARAELRLTAGRADGDGLARLRAEAEGGDGGARLALGRALAAEGEHGEAIEALLAAVADPEVRDDARQALLDVFAARGDGDPLVREGRRRLAAALYV